MTSEARDGFDAAVLRLREPDGSSALHRVELYVADTQERSELVVRMKRNYLGGPQAK